MKTIIMDLLKCRVVLCICIFLISSRSLTIADSLPGDLTNDYQVSIDDLVILAQAWLSGPESIANLNSDDNVNLEDFSIVSQNWHRKISPVVINEFMASNANTLDDEDDDSSDWIEIYNRSEMTIDMTGWYLSDDPDELNMWQFTAGPVLEPGEYGVIFASGKSDASHPMHTNFQLLAEGEYLALSYPDQSAAYEYRLKYPAQTTDVSYGLFEGQLRYFANPSPNGINNNEYFGLVPDTKFSVDRGFYDTPITVVITCDEPNAVIRYTTNSEEPTEVSGIVYSGPIAINRTTVLKAKASKIGWISSNVDTQTYIFVSDVKGQSPNGESPGANWPSGDVNGQHINYGMDPEVVNDPTYSDQIEDSLLSIPSISISTNSDNLFSSSSGIYVNASEEGVDWERPSSMELIYPDGREGFQIDMGLRIRGGWSRTPRNPKHAFRCFFRSQYGDSKLRFPLFGEEGADEFEKIDLRAEQNYSWAFCNDARSTFVHEVFTRDTQGAMGQPYTRSRYYHLYLNGHYWGLYQSQERSEARYAKSYFGGNVDDYDVKKAEAGPYQMVYTDGGTKNQEGTDSFERLYNAAVVTGFADNSDYFRAQGKNPDGTDNPDYEKLLDIDNVIAYNLMCYYYGGIDFPMGLKQDTALMVNNVYCIYNRNNPDGWKFFVHDAEHTFGMREGSGGPDRTRYLNFGSSYTGASYFNPVWLHQALAENEEYRIAFADAVYKHLFNGGALSEEKCFERLLNRLDQVALAIVAESARWGDAIKPYGEGGNWTCGTRSGDPELYRPATKAHWENAIGNLTNFMTGRTDTVYNWIKNRDWLHYPSIDPPVLNINDVPQYGGHISVGEILTMINPNGSGTIYYTLDGSDSHSIGDGTASVIRTTLVDNQAAKKVVIPTQIYPGNDSWRSDYSFNDDTWISGNGGVGFETTSGYQNYIDIDIKTQMDHINASCYIRIPFTFTGAPSDFNYMTLKMRYDDGFIAYLNGTKVKQVNFSDLPTWNAEADNPIEASEEFTSFDITDYLGQLQTGNNLLTIHGLNDDQYSSDFLMCIELEAGEVIPAGVSDTAIKYTGPINLAESTHLKARIFNGSEWSALADAVYADNNVADSLRVSEIMYNPVDPNTEFIELFNTGAEPINLNRVQFTNGIDFTFDNKILAPDQYAVVVQNIATFQVRYPEVASGEIAGQYDGRLNNSGERIELQDAVGTVIQDFTVEDNWHELTDGMGYSLTMVDPASSDLNDWDSKSGWRSSLYAGGTPGRAPETTLAPGSIVINEVLAHSHGTNPDWIELYNTTADQDIDISGWFFSDNNSDPNAIHKYRIPDSTVIHAGTYKVFVGDVSFNAQPPIGDNVPFGLSEGGETVYLYSGQAGEVTGLYQTQQKFDASESGVTLGRYEKPELSGGYDFVRMTDPTQGRANTESTPLIPDIVITEIYYNPTNGTDDEFLELYNRSDHSVTLMTEVKTYTSDIESITEWVSWRIEGTGFEFPAHTTIPPHSSLILARNPANYTGASGPYDGKLDNGGEELEIQIPGDQEFGKSRYWIPIEKVDYNDAAPWPDADGNGNSLHRINIDTYGRDYSNWTAVTPTPGQ